MKRCCKCKAEKPASEYNKHNARKDGLQGQCKACQRKCREALKAERMASPPPIPSEKRCSRCKAVKPASDFNKNKTGKDGLRSRCKACKREYNHQPLVLARRLYGQAAKREVLRTHYGSAHGTAEKKWRKEFSREERRAQKAAVMNTLPPETEIADIMTDGGCALCGRPFELEAHDTHSQHPLAPSIDRIDVSLPTYQDNWRIVHWQCNMAKGEGDDEALLRTVKAIADYQERPHE